jgi:hypothetical protein
LCIEGTLRSFFSGTLTIFSGTLLNFSGTLLSSLWQLIRFFIKKTLMHFFPWTIIKYVGNVMTVSFGNLMVFILGCFGEN